MTATPARIGFITQEFRRATAGPSAQVVDRYGSLARDTPDPVVTFFDDVDHAQVMAQERLALLSATRRLLTITVEDTAVGFGISTAPQIPTSHIVDDERGYSADALIASVEIDTDANTTNLLTWG